MTAKLSISERALEHVNALLPHSSAIGAYAMGMVCTACSQAGIEPSRRILVILKESKSIEDAQKVISEYIGREATHA